MEWYDWRNVRGSLVTFGKAIQGVSPYKVVIEPDESKCPTGYCNFTKRRIAVNPKLFPDRTPKEQYSLTKALLVHEAGHRRFTMPGQAKGVLHLVINILEDQRIENLMSESFAGLRHLVLALCQAMYNDAHPLDADSEAWILRVWANKFFGRSPGRSSASPLGGKDRTTTQGKPVHEEPEAGGEGHAAGTASVDLSRHSNGGRYGPRGHHHPGADREGCPTLGCRPAGAAGRGQGLRAGGREDPVRFPESGKRENWGQATGGPVNTPGCPRIRRDKGNGSPENLAGKQRKMIEPSNKSTSWPHKMRLTPSGFDGSAPGRKRFT